MIENPFLHLYTDEMSGWKYFWLAYLLISNIDICHCLPVNNLLLQESVKFIKLWVRIPFRAGCIRLCDKICQWFSPGTSTYKINHNNIAEILLKVALDTINLNLHFVYVFTRTWNKIICWWWLTEAKVVGFPCALIPSPVQLKLCTKWCLIDKYIKTL
jgi:hypothetical protein